MTHLSPARVSVYAACPPPAPEPTMTTSYWGLALSARMVGIVSIIRPAPKRFQTTAQVGANVLGLTVALARAAEGQQRRHRVQQAPGGGEHREADEPAAGGAAVHAVGLADDLVARRGAA